MEDSILKTVKKIVGLSAEYTPFDLDVLTFTNTAFSVLNDIGIGPNDGFFIEDETATWDQFGVTPVQLHLVKTFVCLKVRTLFDPPTTSFLIEAMQKQLDEYLWRLSVIRDNEITYPEEVIPIDNYG